MSVNREHLCVASDSLSNNRLDSVHSSLSYTHGHNNLTPHFDLSNSSGVQPYQSANSGLSAAAAAVFLLQAATGGSANESATNASHAAVRRCSTSSLFESPQASPLMFSAAAQQALAAAHAIASPRSPAETSGASSFQAAVLSLALAASSNTTSNSSGLHFQDYQRSFCGNSAMNDLISLSEQHHDLLTVHSTLASVLRRRSSTVAPPSFSSIINPNCIETAGQLNDSKVSQSDSQYDTNQQQLRPTDYSESMAPNSNPSLFSFSQRSPMIGGDGGGSDTAASNASHLSYGFRSFDTTCEQSYPMMVHSDLTANKDGATTVLNNYSASADNKIHSAPHHHHHHHHHHQQQQQQHNFQRHTTSSNDTCSLRIYSNNTNNDHHHHHHHHQQQQQHQSNNIASLYKNSTKFDNASPHHAKSSTQSKVGLNYFPDQQVAVSTSHGADSMTAGGCPLASSPFSCSSLSNSTTMQLNISPVNVDSRTILPLVDEFGNNSNTGGSGGNATARSVRSGMNGEFRHDEPNRKREQRLMKNREAARECRRKKKEYVKCLEARVGLLENQNQQLIEELQKVKALCFKELCGLGLNNCAAAVLAAVTPVSSTCLPTANDSIVTSNADSTSGSDSTSMDSVNQTALTMAQATNHVEDQSMAVSNYSADSSANSVGGPRTRHRRQTIFSTSKLSPYAAQTAWISPYSVKYENVTPSTPMANCDEHQHPVESAAASNDAGAKVDDVSLHVYSTIESGRLDTSDWSRTHYDDDFKQTTTKLDDGRGQQKQSDDCEVTSTRTNEVVSNTLSSILSSPSQQHQRSSPIEVVTYANEMHQQHSNTSDCMTAALSSVEGGTIAQCQHPRYAAKRAYRNICNSLHYLASDPNGMEEKRSSKQGASSGDLNTVAEAAVILAAAAAMVAESESSAGSGGGSNKVESKLFA